MFVAVAGAPVVVDAVKAPSVAFHEVLSSTGSPADCSTDWALVFTQRSKQNAASIAARSFDAACDRRSAVLS